MAYRQYKIEFTETYIGYVTGADGLISVDELYIEIDGVELPPTQSARAGVVTYSSAYYGNAGDVFSGKSAEEQDGWINNGGAAAWYAWQDPSTIDVTGFVMGARNAETNRTPKNFTIEYSDNGTTWSVAATYTNVTGWANRESRVFAFASVGAHKHWRINVTANQGDSYTGIASLVWLTSDDKIIHLGTRGYYIGANSYDTTTYSIDGMLDRANTYYWVSGRTVAQTPKPFIPFIFAGGGEVTRFGFKCKERNRMPRDFALYGTDNADYSGWTSIKGWVDEPVWTVGETRYYNVGADVSSAIGIASGTGNATAVGSDAKTSIVGSASATGVANGVGAQVASPQVVGTAGGVGVATGKMFATGTLQMTGVATGLGTATATITAPTLRAGVATATSLALGKGFATGTLATDGSAVGNSFADSGSAATGIISSVGSAVCTSTANAVGSGRLGMVGSAVGVGTGSAVGAYRPTPMVGRAAGVGTASGRATGYSIVYASASARGEALGVLASVRPAVGAAAAQGSAQGRSNATPGTVGTSTATSTATGRGTGLAPCAGTSAGTGTATGTSRAFTSARGVAVASSTANAPSVSLAARAGSAVATSTALGRSTGLAGSVGAAASTSVVVGRFTGLAPTAGWVTGSSLIEGVSAASGRMLGRSAGRGEATGIGVRLDPGLDQEDIVTVEVDDWLVTAKGADDGLVVVAADDAIVVVAGPDLAALAA